MYIKHVRHFLNDEGKKFFPQYVAELNKLIKSKVPGFIRSFHGASECYPAQPQLIICFKPQDALNAWLSTTDHEILLSKLEHYMRKDWQVEGYTIE